MKYSKYPLAALAVGAALVTGCARPLQEAAVPVLPVSDRANSDSRGAQAVDPPLLAGPAQQAEGPEPALAQSDDSVADACSTVVGDRLDNVAGIAMHLLDQAGNATGDKAVICLVRGVENAGAVRNYNPAFLGYADSNTPIAWAAVITADRYGDAYIQTPDEDLQAFGPDSGSIPHDVRGRRVFVSQLLDLTDLTGGGVATFYMGWAGDSRRSAVDATYCGVEVRVDDLGEMDAALTESSCGNSPIASVRAPSDASLTRGIASGDLF